MVKKSVIGGGGGIKLPTSVFLIQGYQLHITERQIKDIHYTIWKYPLNKLKLKLKLHYSSDCVLCGDIHPLESSQNELPITILNDSSA